MRLRRRHLWLSLITAVMLSALVGAVIGCKAQPAEWPALEYGAGDRPPKQRRQTPRQSLLRIVPQSNREVADLNPNDVVQIMRQVGFTDDQILEHSRSLRDALLISGAAQVVYRDRTEATIAVNGAQVYIGSLSRGNFIYDLSYGQFVTPGGRR